MESTGLRWGTVKYSIGCIFIVVETVKFYEVEVSVIPVYASGLITVRGHSALSDVSSDISPSPLYIHRC